MKVYLSQPIVSKNINCQLKVHWKTTSHPLKNMETFPKISVHNQVLTDQSVSSQHSKENPVRGLHPVEIIKKYITKTIKGELKIGGKKGLTTIAALLTEGGCMTLN